MKKQNILPAPTRTLCLVMGVLVKINTTTWLSLMGNLDSTMFVNTKMTTCTGPSTCTESEETEIEP